MTTDEKNTPEPTEAENRNLEKEYADQVAEEHDPYDIDSPIFHGPND